MATKKKEEQQSQQPAFRLMMQLNENEPVAVEAAMQPQFVLLFQKTTQGVDRSQLQINSGEDKVKFFIQEEN